MSMSPECQVCGAALPARRSLTACLACGAPLAESEPAVAAPVAPARNREIQSMAGSMNDELAQAGAEIADRAFNLGCGMSFFLLVGVGLVVYFIGGRNWLMVFIALIPASIAALWGVVLLTDIARTRAIQRVYREEVQPQINNFNRRRRIPPAHFDEVAHRSLPKGAPLLKHIPPLPKEPPLEETAPS